MWNQEMKLAHGVCRTQKAKGISLNERGRRQLERTATK